MSRDYTTKLKILSVFAVVSGVIYLVFKYMLPVVAPFIIALIISVLVDRPVTFLENKCHIKRSIGTLVIVIAAMALLCLFVCYGGKILVKQVYDSINKIEEYKLPFNLNMDIKVINEKIVSGVVDNSPGYISGFTMVFTGVAVFIMATVFISGDMSSIRSSVKKNIFGKEIIYLGRRLKTVLGNYLKTELIIMAITCVICCVGLFIMKNPYALLLGIVIGFVDALPILGTGTIFLPWVLVLVFMHRLKQASMIMILYLICYYTRQFLEPKLMGDKFGMSPTVMLITIYAGLKLFGVMGVFTGPVALILIREISDIVIKKLVIEDK